jgi:hypothetical protein
VWQDLDFLAQVYEVPGHPDVQRITVCRVPGAKPRTDGGADYLDGLTWDDLQYVKRAIGRGHQWAIELFPDDRETINVANMRHLWLIPGPPAFAWSRSWNQQPS